MRGENRISAPITTVNNIDATFYSAIIDVRSPSEFAEDHFPGAINLPVLNDAERARIGTIYKQESPFLAKKLGAALVSANISRAIEEQLIEYDKDFRPLVYCWRGGQRSMSLATVLSRIGWKTSVLEGGYKNYRAWVRNTIEKSCGSLDFTVISGLTGTGKTEILKQLEITGEQIIDLEGLANHRGSLLGDDPNKPQPTQKYFESLLAQQVCQFDNSKKCWVESESNKIGNLHCPEILWQKMQTADEIEIKADMPARIEYLLSHYEHMTHQPEMMIRKIALLKQRLGRELIDGWTAMIENNDWRHFVESILENHYDPAYVKSRKRHSRHMTGRYSLNEISPQQITDICSEILSDSKSRQLNCADR